MSMTKKYWKGIDELKETPAFLKTKDQEFSNPNSIEEFLADEKLGESSTERRDFLKFLGFSVAAATLAACEAPVIKAVPYVFKPENVTPGMPTWYASTYYDGISYASILVKTREGRPIFIKGNKDHGFTKGGVNPQIIASVLGLYDGERLSGPKANGNDSDWNTVDAKIKASLASAGSIAFLTNSIISPSVLRAIEEYKVAYAGKFEHIQYDSISYSAIRKANLQNFGASIIPSYDFSKAKVIISLDADFLSTWLLSNEYAIQYGQRRNPDGEWMSKHFQFESVMTVSGSNADQRAMTRPSELANILSYLISKKGGNAGVANNLASDVKAVADAAVAALAAAGNQAIVVCGSNNVGLQLLTNKLNQLIGAYGTTIDITNTVNLFNGDDEKVNQLVSNVIAGKGPDVLLMSGVNPAYSLPNGQEFAAGLKKIKTSVAISAYMDETASQATYVCPPHHGLEDWADFRAKNNEYAVAQPTIRPLHKTSSTLESLLVWLGKTGRGGKDSKVAYDYIMATYAGMGLVDFNFTVHNSCTPVLSIATAPLTFKDAPVSGLPKATDLEVVLYQKAAIRSGEYANNPWLQEMPDPITKVTWDNYITMNPKEMEDAGYATTYDQENGLNLATLTVNGKSVTLPVYPMPGQALKTVGVALGYGRGANGEKIGKSAFQTKEYGGHVTDENGNPKPIGANVFSMAKFENGTYNYTNAGSLASADGEYLIAATQIHHTVMARHSIIRETTLGIYKHNGKEAYNPAHTLQKLDEHGNHVNVPVSEFDLWEEHPVEVVGHRWAMTIDLSSCIGCGSCLIACQSENNVPVVGKDEVRRGREMHWLRIDRYFSSDEEATIGTRKSDDINYGNAEHPSLNPKVVHMPMMCHHCNHAPCETVCPVAATTHSNEGLNQMAYNRCIGTRYCANNCPYKVRRFNWFNYPSYKKFTEVNPAQDDLGRMVLNPDVTVRTRGVMEKCTFCVQRIQSAKLTAKIESRKVEDTDFATACSDACPTNAIIVGDWNNESSIVRKSTKENRAYQALEEVGIKPNMWYKVKVRNEENKELAALQHTTSHH